MAVLRAMPADQFTRRMLVGCLLVAALAVSLRMAHADDDDDQGEALKIGRVLRVLGQGRILGEHRRRGPGQGDGDGERGREGRGRRGGKGDQRPEPHASHRSEVITDLGPEAAKLVRCTQRGPWREPGRWRWSAGWIRHRARNE